MTNGFLKRITGSTLFVVLTGLLLNGCMGSDTDSVTYNRLGVVQLSSGQQPYLHTSDGYHLTYPGLAISHELQEGACMMIDFKGRLDVKEELTEVELLRSDTIPHWMLRGTLADTTYVSGEQVFTLSSLTGNTFFLNRLLLPSTHTYYQENQQEVFNMFYDPEQSPETADGAHPVYNLYLRVIRSAGSDTIANSYKRSDFFDLTHFVDHIGAIEQSKGSDSLFFHISYASGFNTDSTLWQWTRTSTFGFPLEQ